MTAFKPAVPVITPSADPRLEPPGVAPAPTAKKVVSSRSIVGVPSKSPAPHVNPPRPVPQQAPKKEYAWQLRRRLGKKF